VSGPDLAAAAPRGGATTGWARWARWDEALAAAALALMVLVPLVEIAARPFLGRGIENAPVLVQHLGLLLAMFGFVSTVAYCKFILRGNIIE
jgi:hypothetical protein